MENPKGNLERNTPILMRCCQWQNNRIFFCYYTTFYKYTPSSSVILIVDNDAPLLAVGYAGIVARDCLCFVNYHWLKLKELSLDKTSNISSTINKDVTCPFCGILCDDLVIQSQDETLKVLDNGCPKAVASFESKQAVSSPKIKGKKKGNL